MRRRLLLGPLAGALVAIPAVTAALAASPAVSGVSLSGDANSSPVETTMLATTVSTTPIVDAQYPHAQADVASSVQATAHGSILDPGALVQTLPYEINSNCPPPAPFPHITPPGGCPPFPAYPFGADADSGRPHNAGTVQGGTYGPLTIAAGEYDLNAGQGLADAVVYGGRAALQGAPLEIANGSAHANVHVAGAEVVSTVETRLQGVVIGGVLDIGAIDSRVTTAAISGSPATATGTLAVSGVTVAGVPASIDQEGIHLAGQTLPLPLDPADQALQQLQQAGIAVRLLAPAKHVAKGDSSYSGSTIQVTLTSAQDGSSISVLLGGARASTVAVPFQLLPQATASSLGQAAPPPPGGLPSAIGPSTSTIAGAQGQVILRFAGFTLTPLQLLLALAALLELLLLAGGTTVLWPRPVDVPRPTLTSL
ncbi:MAG TPA: hypothetical protein VF137_10240 [Candidatus Dormibacteraeota bacterium]